MIGVRARHAIAACLAAAAALPARAAPAPLVCVVDPRPAGPSTALLESLAIEARKTGVEAAVVRAGDAGACPAGTAVLLALPDDTRVVVQAAAGARWTADLAAFDPADRAREAARAAIAALPGVRARTAPEILVERDIARPPPPPAVRAAAEPGPRAYALAGGRYEYRPGPGQHAVWLDAEAGVFLFDERLAAGVRGVFQPELPATGGATSASSTAGGVEGVVRGGFPAGPVLLRGAFSAGAEWRRVRLRPPARLDAVSRTAAAAVLGGELEVLVPVAPWLRASLFVAVRGWPRPEGLTWLGRTAYDPPRAGVGAGVRVGVLLPGRAR